VLEPAAHRSWIQLDPGWTQRADVGLIGRCLRELTPVVSGDVRFEPDYRETAPELRIRSELAVPIVAGDEAWGAIDLESDEAGAFDPQDARALQAVAAQVGSALVRLRAERAAGHTLGAS
jgi:GAF domain-containing protein